MARPLKLLLYLVAIVGALGLTVTMIGYLLPQNHVASGEAVLGAAPPTVFATLADVSRYPEWRAGVAKVEVVTPAPLTWREYEGGDVITIEVVEARPPELLRVRIADPELPFGGTWTYRLAPEGSGTRLIITEHGEVYNPIFRFVSRFVLGHTAAIDRFMAALQRRHP